jgi:ssRNA-specific RNase YbeY (16S rRNA maturation enzyme)
MQTTNLYFVLVLSEARNAELNRKVEGFERITKVLSMEVDRQREEIELMKRKGKALKFNHLRKVA